MTKEEATESPLVFVHVPRSGGSTFDQVLRRQYGRQHMFEHYVRTGQNTSEAWDQYKAMPDRTRRALRVVSGHFDHGSHEAYHDSPSYITLLRDPVNRLVSYYYYALRTPKHYLHQLILTHRLSLRDFVLSRASVELDNGATRQICGRTAVGIGECRDDMLDEARAKLEHSFTAFGITERYDESLILFKRLFRWSSQPYWVALSESKERRRLEELSENQIAAIQETNWLDVRLYAFAGELFERRIQEQPADFHREVARFRLENRLVRPLANALNSYVDWRKKRSAARS